MMVRAVCSLPAFSSRRAAAIQPGPWWGLVVITLLSSSRAWWVCGWVGGCLGGRGAQGHQTDSRGRQRRGGGRGGGNKHRRQTGQADRRTARMSGTDVGLHFFHTLPPHNVAHDVSLLSLLHCCSPPTHAPEAPLQYNPNMPLQWQKYHCESLHKPRQHKPKTPLQHTHTPTTHSGTYLFDVGYFAAVADGHAAQVCEVALWVNHSLTRH